MWQWNLLVAYSDISGIKAVTPSALNTPSGANSFTPTATPHNSPDGSPLSTRSNSPEPYEAFSLPQLLLSSVPQFLRDTVGAGAYKKTTFSKSKRRPHRPEKQEVMDSFPLLKIAIFESVFEVWFCLVFMRWFFNFFTNRVFRCLSQ